jgi:hypothetical protein
MTVPTVTDVDAIAAISDPVARNRQITLCYHQLSAAMAQRTGICANWCTFATWASRQAGETIRKQDLRKSMERLLFDDPDIEELLRWVGWFAKQSGVQLPVDEVRRSVVGHFIAEAADKSSEAVGRGNNKVFAEIGREFARFAQACISDEQFNDDHLRDFISALRDGDPPEGQRYLKQAFRRYYLSFFEADAKKAAELRFHANVEIGFHEQTRLQPEITAALNAAIVDPRNVLQIISDLLSKNAGFWKRLLFTVQALVGRTGPLSEKADALAASISLQLRRVVTRHLMTLTIPPDTCLELGTDLQMIYPTSLVTIADSELIVLLNRIDPTKDNLRDTGAVDWSNLSERLHYIADLFRCCHENQSLFLPVQEDTPQFQ